MAPRLRKDLVATTADEQGVACVEVLDPMSGASFRFYDFEYALAQQLTGQPLESVVAWAQSTYGIALSSDTLDQFLEKLAGLGFLASDNPASRPSPAHLLVESANGAAAILAGAGGGETFPRPREPLALLPQIEVLAGPLPPVAVRGDVVSAVETPLGSIARAIAESTAPPPPGALDVGLPGVASPSGEGPVRSPAISRLAAAPSATYPPDPSANASSSTSAGSSSGPSLISSSGSPSNAFLDASSESDRVSDRGHDVDRSQDDRRQPPRPEVVVMPPMAEPSHAENPPRRRWSAALVLLLLGGGLGAAVWFLRPDEGPRTPKSTSPSPLETVPRVHVVSPQPTTFYRWFDVAGAVVPAKDDVLTFRSGGRVQDLLPPGTTFSAGETIARLQGVAERELAVNRLRSRVAFLEQLRDSSRAEGSGEAARQAENKLALRKQDLANAQAALAELEIRPKAAGEIAELLAQRGAAVKPGAAAFRVRATGARATFAFDVDDVMRARALAFCRMETIPGTGGVDGGPSESKARPIDCILSSSVAGGAADERRLTVDLLGTSGVAPGTEVRLASARYDGVFPVPQSAVVRDGAVDHVWIVTGGRRTAENRAVELAASVDALALIARGITVGDAVIVDPPMALKAGDEVEVVQ